ncbi:MAG TPA: ABC transporter permease [Gaiellaceae bacterium]|jgi:peptide/nickel transport system permease protein|nr:ABC transporter permease [Gaiellaceae bacterium]
MFRYLIRRFLWAWVLFLAVTLVTYVIFFLVPASPARLAAGQSATPERVREVEKFLGLDQPVYVQYWRFLKRLVIDRSLGESFINRQSVNGEILRAAPITASLVFGAMILVLMLAIPLGIFSALKPRSLLDRAAMTYVLIGISLPSFWIGLVLSYIVGYRLNLTPIAGYCEVVSVPEAAICGGFTDWAYHMVLPWLTLAIVVAGTYVRFVRAEVMETMTQDYVRTARAKGAPEHQVMRSHILRNAMLPVVTMVGMDIGLLLGGSIFIETVFGLPGLGRTAFEAIGNYDLPTLQGVVIFGAIAIILFTLFVDLLYAWIDPRIRLT